MTNDCNRQCMLDSAGHCWDHETETPMTDLQVFVMWACLSAIGGFVFGAVYVIAELA